MFGRRTVVNIDDYCVYPRVADDAFPPTAFTAQDEALVNNQRLLVNFWVTPGPQSYRVHLNSDTASSALLKTSGSLRKRLIKEVGAEYFPKELLADSLAALGVKKKASPRKDALKASLKSLEEAEKKQVGPQAAEDAEDEEASDQSEDESVGAADYEVGAGFDDDAEGDDDGRDYGDTL